MRVSFTGLFRYADGTDLLLMLVGTVAALSKGLSQPLMAFIFGDVIDAFGGATTDNVLQRVKKVSLDHEHLSLSVNFQNSSACSRHTHISFILVTGPA
jgi:ATP-binding cassette subfamily B (MDR/TAP) protein 1